MNKMTNSYVSCSSRECPLIFVVWPKVRGHVYLCQEILHLNRYTERTDTKSRRTLNRNNIHFNMYRGYVSLFPVECLGVVYMYCVWWEYRLLLWCPVSGVKGALINVYTI